MEVVVLIIKALLYKQYILKLDKEDKNVLFPIKTIYNDCKNMMKKESEKEFNNNKTEFVKLLKETTVLDKTG